MSSRKTFLRNCDKLLELSDNSFSEDEVQIEEEIEVDS